MCNSSKGLYVNRIRWEYNAYDRVREYYHYHIISCLRNIFRAFLIRGGKTYIGLRQSTISSPSLVPKDFKLFLLPLLHQ